MLKIHADASS